MGLGVRELFDNNIKVHFAGSDGGEIFYAALLAAQTKYRLFSCYKYILKCRPDDDFRLPADHVIRVQDTVNRHVIQDSGLFTLMFGAGKGQTQTLESLTATLPSMAVPRVAAGSGITAAPSRARFGTR